MINNTQTTITKAPSEKTERPKHLWIEWVMPETDIADSFAFSKKSLTSQGKNGKENFYCEWN